MSGRRFQKVDARRQRWAQQVSRRERPVEETEHRGDLDVADAFSNDSTNDSSLPSTSEKEAEGVEEDGVPNGSPSPLKSGTEKSARRDLSTDDSSVGAEEEEQPSVRLTADELSGVVSPEDGVEEVPVIPL